jgi:hypothetical protein
MRFAFVTSLIIAAARIEQVVTATEFWAVSEIKAARLWFPFGEIILLFSAYENHRRKLVVLKI